MPQRDLSRMRDLLLLAEKYEPTPINDGDFGMVNVDLIFGNDDFLSIEDEYQLWLLDRSGWIESVSGDPRYFRITPDGHDYLDAVRDESVWAKTKQLVKETGGNATLEIVKSIAVGFLKTKIRQHTDIEL